MVGEYSPCLLVEHVSGGVALSLCEGRACDVVIAVLRVTAGSCRVTAIW
jgi:hypothetical protein